jgi:transposase
MIKVGRTVKAHLWGILNAIQLKATNAIAESVNATIQKIKARACGFRNRTRFRTAILFHKGGLSLLPTGICEMVTTHGNDEYQCPFGGEACN